MRAVAERFRGGLMALAGTCLLLLVGVAAANPEALTGQRQIFLVDREGTEYLIGSVYFYDSEDEQIPYELTVERSQFEDYLISMRYVKCLGGPDIWCLMRYQHEHPRTVTRSDLSWLEHDLLFLFKPPEEMGLDPWNGIYYQMRLEEDRIVGRARGVDINVMVGTDESGRPPRYADYQIADIDLSERWLPTLVIRHSGAMIR